MGTLCWLQSCELRAHFADHLADGVPRSLALRSTLARSHLLSYKKLAQDVKPGSQILCADGSIVLVGARAGVAGNGERAGVAATE